MITAITLAGELLVNNALRFDPASRQQLGQLTDILAVELTSPAVTFYCRGHCPDSCHGNDRGIRISHYCDKPVRTRLKGSPAALFSLLKQPNNLADTGVELTGDAGLLQQWQFVLSNLDIDWEEAVSRVLTGAFGRSGGDRAGNNTAADIIAAVIVGKFRQGASRVKRQQQEQKRLLQEYLTEEWQLFPARAEMTGLVEQNHDLTMKLDRLGARIEALMQQRVGQTGDRSPSGEGEP